VLVDRVARQELHGADTPAFLEGPSFDAKGNLWVVDIPYGRLFRMDPQGRMECMLEYDGEPNGMVFHPDGRAFIADNKNGVMVFDPFSGKVEAFLDRALVVPTIGNDPALAFFKERP